MAIDFDKEFESFALSGDRSYVKDIHEIIPGLTDEEMKVVHALMPFAIEYKSIELMEFIKQYLKDKNRNKNLNLVRSMNLKSLLKSAFLEEQLRGVKINQTNTNGDL